MVELNNFSMVKVVLIQWKANQRVIGFVSVLTRTSAELGIALSYFVSFAVSSPTWRSQSDKGNFPLVILSPSHEGEVSIVLPNY